MTPIIKSRRKFLCGLAALFGIKGRGKAGAAGKPELPSLPDSLPENWRLIIHKARQVGASDYARRSAQDRITLDAARLSAAYQLGYPASVNRATRNPFKP